MWEDYRAREQALVALGVLSSLFPITHAVFLIPADLVASLKHFGEFFLYDKSPRTIVKSGFVFPIAFSVFLPSAPQLTSPTVGQIVILCKCLRVQPNDQK